MSAMKRRLFNVLAAVSLVLLCVFLAQRVVGLRWPIGFATIKYNFNDGTGRIATTHLRTVQTTFGLPVGTLVIPYGFLVTAAAILPTVWLFMYTFRQRKEPRGFPVVQRTSESVNISR
jgi:hypothetical protein